jgi:two-component system, NarL family, nitrate/nitrite response regulator NarL
LFFIIDFGAKILMPNEKVLLVGPHWLLRQGIKPLLKRLQLVVSGEGEDFAEAYQHFDRTGPPDIVMFLASRTDDIAGVLTQLRKVREDFAAIKLVVLAERSSTHDVITALQAGADGILSSNISSKMLLSSLQLVMLGQKLFSAWPSDLLAKPREPAPMRPLVVAEKTLPASPPQVVQFEPRTLPQQPAALAVAPHAVLRAPIVRTDAAGSPVLSDREKQILRCLVRGQSNKVIARELGIAETTVKVHIKSVLRKLRAANRTQAAIWALNHDHGSEPCNDSEPCAVAVRHPAG